MNTKELRTTVTFLYQFVVDLDLQNDNLSLKKSFYFILLHSTDLFVLIKVVQSSVKIVLK